MSEQLSEDRILATDEALKLIAEIRDDHPEIMFHQSGGCCDGSSPMCYPLGQLLVGDQDLLLGHVGGAPFYIGRAQFVAWGKPRLIVDAIPGRGAMFSLDNGRERRFLIRSDRCAAPIG